MTLDISVAIGEGIYFQGRLVEKKYRLCAEFDLKNADPLSWSDFPNELYAGLLGYGKMRILRGCHADQLVSIRNFRTADDRAPEQIFVNWVGSMWFVQTPAVTDHLDLYVADLSVMRIPMRRRVYADSNK